MTKAETAKIMLICGRCSMRVHKLAPGDVPDRGIVCGRCGYRIMAKEAKPDPGRRKPVELPACEFRGEQVSSINCGCAGGKVRVFACAHAENTDAVALSYRPTELHELPLPSCRQCPFNREPTAPSLLQMAVSATKAAVAFAASGGKTVSRELRVARLATCKGCSSLNGSQCADCGCLVAIKTWLPKEHCPQGKW